MKTDPSAPPLPEPTDFSLVLGGPLYQLMRRVHLSGDVLELVARRVIILVLLAWLPLLALSIVEGRAWGDSVKLPFLFDADVHARFLLALPLLIVAELVVHQRMRLARTRRVGLAEYGGLAQRYVREFDQKWLRGGAPAGEPLVGSADLQSLADLGNSFEVVKGMKPVPFGKDTVLQLAMISLAPVAPLVLTIIPLGELLDRFLKVIL